MTTSALPSRKNNSALIADWAVIVLTLLALIAGSLVKSGVENRSVPFEASGISAQTPLGWMTTSVKGTEILHVTDLLSSGFGTTYILQDIPVASDAVVGQVVSLLTLQYGQELTAFRVLDQKQVTVYGQPAYEIGYVFVESNPNLTHNEIPNVVRGLDYIFMADGHAVVATYRAGESAYSSDLGRFLQFLRTLKF
jgi:hypothetical protein